MLHPPLAAVLMALALASCASVQVDGSPTTRSPASASTSIVPEPCRDAGGPLPQPSGRHLVGTTQVHAAPELGHLNAFYPAASCTRAHPRYLRPELVQVLGLDPSALDRVVVHAGKDAKPLGGPPRPVVVIAPGWTSLVALSTSLATDLASHGYVVITTDPPLGTEISRFPDADSAERRLRALRGVLDLLDDPATESIIGPVDRSRIAAGGHSYAGSVAFELAQEDGRLAAVFDLDGVLHGAVLTAPMRAPALIVATSDGSAGDPTLGAVLSQSPDAVGIVVQRAAHFDLTDVPALVDTLGPLTATLAHGPIGAPAVRATDQLVVRFLDCVLGVASVLERSCAPSAAALAAGLVDVAPLTATPASD